MREEAPGLPAGRLPLYQHRLEALRRPVDRRGQPRRTAPDDDQIIKRPLGARPEPHLLGDLDVLRRLQVSPVGEHDEREPRLTAVRLRHELAGLFGGLHVLPLVGHPVAGQEVLHRVGERRPAVTYHPDALEGWPVGGVPVAE